MPRLALLGVLSRVLSTLLVGALLAAGAEVLAGPSQALAPASSIATSRQGDRSELRIAEAIAELR